MLNENRTRRLGSFQGHTAHGLELTVCELFCQNVFFTFQI
jgi:hypothetical protein